MSSKINSLDDKGLESVYAIIKKHHSDMNISKNNILLSFNKLNKNCFKELETFLNKQEVVLKNESVFHRVEKKKVFSEKLTDILLDILYKMKNVPSKKKETPEPVIEKKKKRVLKKVVKKKEEILSDDDSIYDYFKSYSIIKEYDEKNKVKEEIEEIEEIQSEETKSEETKSETNTTISSKDTISLSSMSSFLSSDSNNYSEIYTDED